MGIIERKKSILLNEPHLATASGSVAIFDTDLRSKLKECKINFLPVQSGSGDPSPTNIRPISGRTGISINNNGDTISVSWQTEAGTLYGGYVDLVSGELIAEWDTVSLGQLNYSLNTVLSGVDRFYTTIANVVPTAGSKDIPNVISDIFKAEAINDANIKHSVWSVCCNGSTYYFYTPSGEYSSSTEFKNAMKDTQFLCKRRTPIATYQLTPQQIKTFIGRNNIWSDAGDVEVQYWKH